MKKILRFSIYSLLLINLFLSFPSYAQLKGGNILGDLGLNAGTQGPASINVFLPVYYYTAGKYAIDNDASINTDLNTFLTGLGVTGVTNVKILGGNWGFNSILIPFASNRVEGNMVSMKSSLAFTDIYLQPIQLGWHTKSADFTAGYGMFIPTGKYTLGGENSGLGMFINEFSAATTLFLDQKKSFSFASSFAYEIHGKKKDTDIKTGDILSIEGGLAKTIYKPVEGSPVPKIFNAGIIYYMQFKVTEDDIPVGNLDFGGDKDHIFGAGLEGNVFFPKTRLMVDARWVTEFGAKNRFQGNTFFLNFIYMIKSFHKVKE